MNQRINESDSIKGNPEAIREMTDTILKIIGMYVQQVPTTMIDYFLSINNVHKLVIADLATRWAKDSHPEEQTYRMADRMFRESMKELRRNLPLKIQQADALLRMDPLASTPSSLAAEEAAVESLEERQTEPSK